MKSLLEKHGVHAPIVTWMAEPSTGCFSVDIFANWVVEKKELQENILAKTNLRDDSGKLARLKMAWRQVEAMVARGIKRSSDGLPRKDMDAPLDPEVHKSRIALFTTYYNWKRIDGRRFASDGLFGRISREFDRRQPIMYAVSRVKTQARAQRQAPPKREKLSDGVVLEHEAPDDKEGSLATTAIHGYSEALYTLRFSWAVAGCFPRGVRWLAMTCHCGRGSLPLGVRC